MGNVIVGTRESVRGVDGGVSCGISEFEHCFAASLEDASPGVTPEPLEGYAPSMSPPSMSRRSSADTVNEPLTGRLVVVHMLETEIVLRETFGVREQTVTSIPYAAIRRLTWDHSQSSLKVGYASIASPEDGEVIDGDECDPDEVYISIRVENSLELEDELKQRARGEAKRAAAAGESAPSNPASVYLGIFAGFTKPKPFQRKRPNLSYAVPEGKLPTLKEMRRWSLVEHAGISQPQTNSMRPKMAMDAIFLGENRFPLSAVDGLTASACEESSLKVRSRYGELVLTFACVEVQLWAECGENATFSYDSIDDWAVVDVPGKGSRAPSGLELWINPAEEQDDRHSQRSDEGEDDEVAGKGNLPAAPHANHHHHHHHHRRADRRHVLLGIPDEDLVLARNAMEYFWNRRRAELNLPPKAGSTHGRCVASLITLRGEVEAPAIPTGRVDPVDRDGVELRVGQVVVPSPRRGQLELLSSPRALLGVEKKRTLSYNSRARWQWEHVVLHQGWLRKRGGGAMKRWIWRYFVLYDTPQGHFLGYYNDASDVPLFNEARKERQLVDLCKVCFLRPETTRPKQHPAFELPRNAFSIVTTERQWTLCADSKAGVLQWLRMLSVAVDEDVAVVDDGEALFQVRVHWADDGDCYGPEYTATVHLGSMGLELRLGCQEATSALAGLVQPKRGWGSGDGEACAMGHGARTRFWSFTDFYKWTIVYLQDGIPGLAIQCFSDNGFDARENILMITSQAKRLALAIEHQVEKFMSVMHLRLEDPTDMHYSAAVLASDHSARAESLSTGSDASRSDDAIQSEGGASASEGARSSTQFQRVPSMNLATDTGTWGGDFGSCLGDSGRFATSGNNPFDSSSDEEEEEDDEEADNVGGPTRQTSPRGSNNPFDLPFDHGEQKNDSWGEDGGGRGRGGGSGGSGEAPQGADKNATGPLSAAKSTAIDQFFLAVPSPATGVDPTNDEGGEAWLPSVDPPSPAYAANQLRQDVPPRTSPAAVPSVDRWSHALVNPASTGEVSCPRDGSVGSPSMLLYSSPVVEKCRSPKPPHGFDNIVEGSSRPTPPVTPLPPPHHAKDPVDLLATFLDSTETSVPPARRIESSDKLSTFRESTDASMPPPPPVLSAAAAACALELAPSGSKEGVGSESAKQPGFNPFARPESCGVAPEKSVSTVRGKVISGYGDPLRVIVENRATSGATFSLTLRYELHFASATCLKVGLLHEGAPHSALKVSFDPTIDSAALGGGGGEPEDLRHEVSVTCLRPFSSPPSIFLTTRSPQNVADAPATTTRVCLPVTVAAFLKGLAVNPQEFRQRWSSLSSTEHTAQAVVRSAETETRRIDSRRDSPKSTVEPAAVRRFLTETLGMAEVACETQGAASGVELIAAAGVLLTTSTVASEGVVDDEGGSITCLVGVELHDTTGAARVTSKSTDRVLAEGVLKEVLKGVRAAAGGC